MTKLNWQNNAAGDWAESKNWDGGVIPTASDDLVVSNQSNNWDAINFTSNGIFNSLSVASGTWITIKSDIKLLSDLYFPWNANITLDGGRLSAKNIISPKVNGGGYITGNGAVSVEERSGDYVGFSARNGLLTVEGKMGNDYWGVFRVDDYSTLSLNVTTLSKSDLVYDGNFATFSLKYPELYTGRINFYNDLGVYGQTLNLANTKVESALYDTVSHQLKIADDYGIQYTYFITDGISNGIYDTIKYYDVKFTSDGKGGTNLYWGDTSKPDNIIRGDDKGNKILASVGGNSDLFDGKIGNDTVLFKSTYSDFDVQINNGYSKIADKLPNRYGNDTLLNVERLQFSDTNIALDINDNAGEAYRIYEAAFNRKPDAGGLGFWIAQLDKGTTLKSVAEGFLSSAEFKALYGSSPTNAAFVDNLYKNILDRTGEKGGVDYWNGVLNNGVSRADVLVSFSESDENKAGVIGSIQNGIEYKEWLG